MSAGYLLILALAMFVILWFADPITDAIARLFPRVSDEADAKIRKTLEGLKRDR